MLLEPQIQSREEQPRICCRHTASVSLKEIDGRDKVEDLRRIGEWYAVHERWRRKKVQDLIRQTRLVRVVYRQMSLNRMA